MADVETQSAPTTTQRGRAAEDIAALHLGRIGYRVLARNVYLAGAELDIIAMDGAILSFVEVRRRVEREDALGSVGPRKQHSLTRAARLYLARQRTLPRCRFDVVAVYGPRGRERVDVVKGAFEAAP